MADPPLPTVADLQTANRVLERLIAEYAEDAAPRVVLLEAQRLVQRAIQIYRLEFH